MANTAPHSFPDTPIKIRPVQLVVCLTLLMTSATAAAIWGLGLEAGHVFIQTLAVIAGGTALFGGLFAYVLVDTERARPQRTRPPVLPAPGGEGLLQTPCA
jgi:hypothetical protein